jgi:hypothetical protein
MAMKPKIQGDYARHPRGSNDQGSPKGAFSDRVVARGGQSPLGNNEFFRRNLNPTVIQGVATSGGPGVGRETSKSGSNDQYGQSEREYSNPAMDDLDRYYGYGRRG